MPEREFELLKTAEEIAAFVLENLKKLERTIALAESCTAGLISNLLANTAGASEVLWGSFVCYTKEAKISMLGISEDLLKTHGLVSEETALLMAKAALEKSGADIGASVTGLTGPLGDGSSVPVGTVWTAIALKNGETKAREFHFTGSRNENRLHAAITVLKNIKDVLTQV